MNKRDAKDRLMVQATYGISRDEMERRTQEHFLATVEWLKSPAGTEIPKLSYRD
jgi:hypothetical protein